MTESHVINNLSLSLDYLQKICIGLFRYHGDKYIHLVVNKDGDLLKTVVIGKLGGITTIHVPEDKGIFKPFPENVSLYEFKKDPYALHEFLKEIEN